ncbi:MAG TPA: penicillin acylase family protein [Gemmatimonadales bacterium]|nr:penicillin acylase family protein [Gemmatimonadales bacterium]
MPSPPDRFQLLRAIPAILVLGGALWLGGRGAGPLPALGPLLDPWNGLYAVAATAELPASASAAVAGLGDSVTIRYDSRGVPHIFAQHEADAWRALGYVVARDRLFQLELQARAGAGTLTEIAGRAALGLDKEARRLGMPRAAERKLASLDTTSQAWQSIAAYSDGVNAWIDHLDQRHLPIEYRLLGKRPARWRPIDCIHLFNRMGLTLAMSEAELEHLAAARLVGRAAADALYPVNSPLQEPIQPNGQHGPRFDAQRIPPPGAPDSGAMLAWASLRASADFPSPTAGDGDDRIGSNNWAVAPRRTKDGYALLAGDPHLDLSLPSIWYEAHLVVPGKLDVYGVTIAGAPTIVIGFNRNVAWSFTNTEGDVTDYYAETVDNEESPRQYRLDGQWRPLEIRVERYFDAAGQTIWVDSLRFTHRGSLRKLANRWISTRWTMLETPFDGSTLLNAARAGSTRQWLEAMSNWGGPAQNMIVADKAGTIAIRSTGRFPLRPGDGKGTWLRDGSRSASDWIGYWPLSQYPQAIDPAQGYLASANQQPIDPKVNPAYFGANWASPWRAMEINRRLRADSAATPDSLRAMQTDPASPRADLMVPAFLAAAHARPGDSTLQRAAALLAQWDRRYTKDNNRAILFETAMSRLTDLLWDELMTPGGRREDIEQPPYPSLMVAAELLQDPANAWWDDRRTTDRVETRDDILTEALQGALAECLTSFGDPDGPGWRWSARWKLEVPHLMRLPGFSSPQIAVQSGPSTVSPYSRGQAFGASWRMVVQLGPEVHAWGTYPGGQSGNPASRRYLEHLDQWSRGELDSLRFPASPADLGDKETSARLTLRRAP